MCKIRLMTKEKISRLCKVRIMIRKMRKKENVKESRNRTKTRGKDWDRRKIGT